MWSVPFDFQINKKLISSWSHSQNLYNTFRWSSAHIHPFSCTVLVEKLFGRSSSFSFQLTCGSIIFKFDLPLSVRKEPLITGSVILLISQYIDSMQLKWKGCLPPLGNNKQCCLSIKGFIGEYGTRNILWKIVLYRPKIKYLISTLI